MKPGDLVRLESVFKDPMPLYSTWGNKVGGGDKPIDTIHRDEIGVVLETTQHRGGNGVRVLFSGRTGWTNLNFLTKET